MHQHFNNDVTSWNIESVTSMDVMLNNAQECSSDVSSWYVSNIDYM